MTRYLTHTLSDIRGGRESWRVVALFAVPSFVLSFALVLG